MKNLVLIFSILFIISTSAVSQDMSQQSPFKIRLSTGLAMPMGDFKAVQGEKAGLATPGLVGMLEVTKPVTEYLDVTLSATFAYNDMNVYKIEEELSKIISPVFVSSCSYYTSWFMAGAQIGHDAFEHSRFYFNANVGLLFSSFPDITIKYQGQTATQEYESKITLGFGLGAGFQYDFLNVGIRYLAGTPTVKATPGNGRETEVPISVLLLMFGITF